MDEDDEFGDLYADVLRPIPGPSPSPSPSPNPPIPSPPPPPKPQTPTPLPAEDSILGPAPIPEDHPEPHPEPSSPTIRAPEAAKPEGEQGIGDFDIELDIPGVGEGVAFEGAAADAKSAAGEEWDSDSEDDLRIVLNDDGVEDEDGEDDLVIVADGGQHHRQQYQALEEQEWGEEALQAGPDGERKEAGEAAKGGAAAAAAGQRVGYAHGYHPQHHSQFKYIRPGAVDIPGGAPVHGGVPGQVRPPLTMGLAAGRGRGAQKGFYSGYGWANNSLPRPFGIGLDFTLPSHKTIFDVNIDAFDEKPWRLQGIDITDFFNFGLDEASWKDYCKQLEQFRLESTMQSKIRVYESGRSDHDYDPDLPPELAAASGLQDLPAEKTHPGKMDSGQLDLFSQGMAATHRQSQLPTGRAIQVESGYGERLPSMDTRPPRTRDFEAVIEIVCQDFVDETDKSNMGPSQPGTGPIGDGPKGCCSSEEHNRRDEPEYNECLPRLQHDKRETIFCEVPTADSSHNNAPEVSSAAENLEPQNERQTIERKNKSMDNDFDADNVSELSPSSGVEKMKEPSTELKDEDLDDRLVLPNSPTEGEDLPSDLHVSTDSHNDHSSSYPAKKLKLSSQVEHTAVQANGDAEDLKTTVSDYSRAKSGSSLDYMKQGEGDEDEVMQAGGSRDSDLGREHSEGRGSSPYREDYVQESRHVINGDHIPSNGREDLPRSRPRRSLESNSVEYECIEGFERVEERGASSGLWNRRDSHDLARKDKDAKRRQSEEVRIKDRNRTLVSDRKSRGDDPYPRKSNDNNEWRAHFGREGPLRQRERSSVSMKQHDYFEDVQANRRKDEEQRKRESVSKENLHGHHIRDDGSHSRRGRNDGSENRIKEDVIRVRDRMGNPRSSKHKDDSSKQREREERQRLKVEGYMHAHRDKEDLRSGAKGGRSLEDKSYGSNLKIRGERAGSDNDPVNRRHDPSRRGEQAKGESHSQHKSREELNVSLSQVSREEKSSRHGRVNSQGAHGSGAFGNRHMYREMDREKSKKSKNLADHNGLVPGKRKYEDYTINQREKSRQTSPFDSSVKTALNEEPDNASDGLHSKKDQHGSGEKAEGSGDVCTDNRDEIISDDENQQESRRGRSKLERWMSHKERDYTLHRGQSSSSLRADDMNGNNRDIVLCDELTMTEANKDAENIDNKDPTAVDNSVKEERDRHLETVEKLKKRSERFNLPMPGEKETLAAKKVESELPLVQNEPVVESEVKQERPTRKRRWVSG